LPSSLAVVAMLSVCAAGMLSGAAAQVAEPEAEDVEAGRLVIDRRGALSLYGQPFRAQPAESTFRPRALTLWLPENISLLGGKVKPCSRAEVRNTEFPDGLNGCTAIAAGRLNSREGNNFRSSWYALAGPKRGDERLVWMTTKLETDANPDGETSGLDTGVIREASGAYGTKLVLRFDDLNFRTRGLEAQIGQLRETSKCPSGGWPMKVKTVAAEGTDSVAWRARCSGGGGGGR
jgi:hypothetical protein